MKNLLSAILSALIFVTAARTTAGQETYSRTTHYDVQIKSGLLAPVVWIYLTVNNMHWNKISIRTILQKDDAGNEKVTEVTVWPDNTETDNPKESEIIFRLSRNLKSDSSFIHFLHKTKFKESEIFPLLDLYAYLYDGREQEMKFECQNIFDSEPGNMRLRFMKKISPAGNVIAIQSLNGSGNANAWIEAVMKSSPENHPEKISAKMKLGGIKVILTEIKDIR